MKFNAKELSFIAQEHSREFDKEGFLFMKDKKEGLFKKGEAFVQRFFRLRGNLLFYLKGKEKNSELLGVFVLERCSVQLDNEDELPYTFILVFDKEERSVQLAAGSEEERDDWIGRLHIAGYECMHMQLHSLREQIAARTGKDPIEDPEPSALPGVNSGSRFGDQEPFFKICLSCVELHQDVDGREPDTYASVHYMTPPHMQWVPHAHTEVFEKSCNPTYLTTVGFTAADCLEPSTRVRLIVYTVRERMTGTNVGNEKSQLAQMGMCVFTLADLFTAPKGRLKLKLASSLRYDEVGHVVVLGWTNGRQSLLQELQQAKQTETETPAEARDSTASTLSLAVSKQLQRLRGSQTRRVDQLRHLYENIIIKSFRYPTNDGRQLWVLEYMAESKYTFTLPRQLLQIWIDEEKEYIASLKDLGQLYGIDGENCRALQDNSMSLSSVYTQLHDYLGAYTGSSFKSSSRKADKELEFAPTNLHLQRLWVTNDYAEKSACYDVTTVGCFTAYAQKYKQGGLRRMLRALHDNLQTSQSEAGMGGGGGAEGGGNVLDTVNSILNDITRLRNKVELLCEEVCRCAVQAKAPDLTESVAQLADKLRQLLSVCQHPLIEDGYNAYNRAAPSPSNYSDEFLQPPDTGQNGQSEGGEYSEGHLKWNGNDFVRSPTQEPFELTRLNTEAALVCVLSAVEELTSRSHDQQEVTSRPRDHHSATPTPTHWLHELSPLVIRLSRCVVVMCTRARSSLTFLTLHVCGPHIALLHSVKYRRDVVFAQALTAAVSAVMTRLRSNLQDEAFLQQLVRVGLLLEFEGLLSCYGDEMGMLEDMAVGVADLNHVTLKVKAVDKVDHIGVEVEGNSLLKEGFYPDYCRPTYTVYVPVSRAVFSLLPRELQRGHALKLIPVLFNIGINEQATLAEKFGDVSLQYDLNQENFEVLYKYYKNCVERLGTAFPQSGRSGLPLKTLIQQLSVNVNARKSKNVEVLHQAAEICCKLRGLCLTGCTSGKDRTSMSVTLEQFHVLQQGICRKLRGLRLTSCKSGKDRTSMSVTLEQVHVLQTWICRKLRGLRLTSCKSGKDRTSMSVTLEQVHVLQTWICRKLRGLRLTSCKSGKDRTSMSVTLEQVHVLQTWICRKLRGLRLTSCKSGKDRSSMSVTLEQVQVLQAENGLAAHMYKHVLECMRSEGTRRENTLKNVGVRKYAFTSLQLMSFPKLYRPPRGTFGNVQS